MFHAAALALALPLLLSPETPGTLLPTGWRISPAGEHVQLDTFPMSLRVSPDGRYIAVLNAGYKKPSLWLLDAGTRKLLSTIPLKDAWLGLTFNRRGDRIYVGGGHESTVFEFLLESGQLRAGRQFTLAWPDGRFPRSFVGDIVLSPDETEIFAAEVYQDSVAVLSTQTGKLLRRFPTGRRPYKLALDARGRNLLVSAFSDNRVEVYNTRNGQLSGKLDTSPGPSDIACDNNASTCYVTGSNSNYVDVIRWTKSGLKPLERINVALAPQAPTGMTPSGVAIDRQRKRVYIILADANSVAVIDRSRPDSRVLGFVPTGWYPTSGAVLKDGSLMVLNGKGEKSFANPKGPNPLTDRTMLPQLPTEIEYVGLLQLGTARVIAPFTPARLKDYTRTVFASAPNQRAAAPFVSPMPAIRHVIYIMKENRTYDQILGDLGTGNGDPSLTLFPEKVTPNHHKLAREFVLFDNFFVNADVSAEGWFWSSAAISPPFVARTWGAGYGNRAKPQGAPKPEPSTKPAGGFIWNLALRAGLKVRNYGFFVGNRPGAKVGEILLQSIRDPELEPFTNPYYAGYDPAFPDIERAKIFLRDFAEFERSGELPNLITMILPNDHTFGTDPGAPAPFSSVADNDAALGMIVEAVSKSRFWPNTAILVLEDDAQNGADHVDSHRSIAYVISPYTKRKAVDSSFYNTTSMLRTIELLLGLGSMTHYDAWAGSFLPAFQQKPDLTPYTAEQPRERLDLKNPPRRKGDGLRTLNMTRPDEADDDELNEILWRAIKKTAPPPPVRSYVPGNAGQ